MNSDGTHRTTSLGPGHTVDTGDQVSSLLLLGLAVVGAAAAVLLNAVL